MDDLEFEYKHQYLIITLDEEYTTEESQRLANAIMEFTKVIGVQAAKKVRRVK